MENRVDGESPCRRDQGEGRGDRVKRRVSSFLSFVLPVFLFLTVLSGFLPGGRNRQAHVRTLAGSGIRGLRDGPGRDARFNWPTGVVVDRQGNIFVADFFNNAIRKVIPDGRVITFAGSGRAGSADGRGRSAEFHGPDTLAIDQQGVLYVADADNFRVRRITPDGVVSTLAGSVQGDADGRREEAQFVYPTGVAVDRRGTIYVADRGAHKVKRITPDGVVTTLAGQGSAGHADGPVSQALFHDPMTLAIDATGNIFVADSGNHSIRKITPELEVITMAGDPHAGYVDGQGRTARFHWPTGVILDHEGNLYVSDSENNRIRKVTPDGTVSTVAGAGGRGFFDGPGEMARFAFPTGIEVDPAGALYVADSANHMVRKITDGEVVLAEVR